jgi:hypothetical protein
MRLTHVAHLSLECSVSMCLGSVALWSNVSICLSHFSLQDLNILSCGLPSVPLHSLRFWTSRGTHHPRILSFIRALIFYPRVAYLNMSTSRLVASSGAVDAVAATRGCGLFLPSASQGFSCLLPCTPVRSCLGPLLALSQET